MARKQLELVIAGTGHRPKFCPCKYDDRHPWLKKLKNDLYADLDIGWNTGKIGGVISGMAIGWDTWIAEVALEIGIPVSAYVPFEGQGSKWPTKTKENYERIIEQCKDVRFLSQSYHPQAFFKRDRAMVDDCDMVFALLNPMADEGGTFYTVKYAKENNKQIENYWRD